MPSADSTRTDDDAIGLSLASASVGTRLRTVSLTLRPGDCCVLLGPNGAGKSTLLRAMAGLERLTAGQVLLGDRALGALTPRERAASVAWLPQRPDLGEAVRVDELVSSGRYRFGESRGEALAHARRALAEVAAEHLAERACDRISGGELQRALLATLLAQQAPLLLVDEPANHLDPAQQIAIYRTLGGLWQRGRGLLVVTHDVNLAKYLGPAEHVRVLSLRDGALDFESTLDAPELLAELERLYGIPYAELSVSGQRHFAPRGELP